MTAPTKGDWARVERVLRATPPPVLPAEQGRLGDLLCVLQSDAIAMLVEQREELLSQIAEAIAPGYSDFPASDAEILAHARDVVARLRGAQ